MRLSLSRLDTSVSAWLAFACASALGANATVIAATPQAAPASQTMSRKEQQTTVRRSGHILTNIGVWSPDGEWIVYDTRTDPAGNQFDGTRIEMVRVATGEVKVLYESRFEAHCGVATFNPRREEVIFILGPENPSPDWQYGFWHRQGVIVEVAQTGQAKNLDACDLVPPFTPGALRGGSHVHVWDAAGQWVSFTYEDHVLAGFQEETVDHEINLRNVGVSVPGRPVRVSPGHPRNHNGEYFSVLVTRTTAHPKPGSDEIKKACEEGWVGTNGYLRPDGSRQTHALAFQGQVVTTRGEAVNEVFIVDLPEDLSVPGEGPLPGTETRRPVPPRGTVQRRLTRTAGRKFPGVQGPRHWLRCSPDGTRIACLMKDDVGLAQLCTVSPNGGDIVQVTRNPWSIASAFTWSPDGRYLAHVMDRSVCVTEIATGSTHRLTEPSAEATAPRPEACVFSPDGTRIAFVRTVPTGAVPCNQVFVTEFKK
jgi:hypothetical protein